MDVECRPEIELRHGRALEVPARTAGSPRCRPRGLTGLDGLPEGEVARIALALGRTLALMNVVEFVAGQCAVLGVALHVEVDVAARRVRVAVLDQDRKST